MTRRSGRVKTSAAAHALPRTAHGPGVHTPVLLAEVLDALALSRGGRVIDATIDGGGHALAIMERLGPEGAVLGLDRDPTLLGFLRERAAAAVESGRLRLVAESFAALEAVARATGFAPADAILFDLGLSSHHLEASGRGFSFERPEPLDLRFDPGDANRPRAADLVRRLPAERLAALIADYGEERHARAIARAIERARRARPVETATELRDCVLAALPGHARRHGRRSVARVFQALRIAVNDELDALGEALPQIPAVLRPGGRVAIIAFHSLEDRMVKRFFREADAAGTLCIVTRKPVRPGDAETRANPRARAARLRVAARPSA
jgi:16S rRNA (cytosine1402-N4)-methyltransferase